MKRLTICSTSFLSLLFSGCAGVGPTRPSIRVPASPVNSLAIDSKVELPQPSEPARPPLIEMVAYQLDTSSEGSDADASGIPLPRSSARDTAGAGFIELAPRAALQSDDIRLAHNAQPEMADGKGGNGLHHDGQASYTLADIEQMALGNNPSIAAAGATARKAAGLWNQVGKKPNPTLGYFGQQLADRNTDQHGLFVEQEFVRANKLKLNQAVLSHTTNAQRWENETQQQRVLTDVRVRFFEAIAAQQQLEASLQFAEVARRGVEVALQRQQAEEGTLIEVLQSKTLLSEITLAAEQSEAAYFGAWKDLAAVAGLSSSAPARLVAEFQTPDLAPDWNTTFNEIVARSPELSVARALVCEKSALVKRHQVQMVPNVTGQLGAGYDSGTDSGMINVQVSAPIPVWNNNQGNISAAYSDYTRAVQEVARIEQSIKSRLARAAQEFDASIASVKRYEHEIIPQARQSLELSEEAYRAGEIDFLQVLLVRRSYYESMIRSIEAKGRLAQSNARIDGLVLTGGLDAPQDYTDGDGIRGASFGGQ